MTNKNDTVLRNVVISVSCFIVYIVIGITCAPLHGYRIYSLIPGAVCALIIGWLGNRWSWLKIVLFISLVTVFNITTMHYIATPNLNGRDSLFEILAHVICGNYGVILLEISVIALLSPASFCLKKYIIRSAIKKF